MKSLLPQADEITEANVHAAERKHEARHASYGGSVSNDEARIIINGTNEATHADYKMNLAEPRLVPQVPQKKWFGEGTKRAFPR